MSRIRTIKPEFWTSDQVAECSPNSRLLFIGMWNFCDDAGIHPASVARLKMEIFPADSFTKEDVRRMVDELIKNNLIEEYKVDEETFWRVKGWKHQKIDQPTFKFPHPNGDIPSTPNRRRVFGEHSENVHHINADQTNSVHDGREGNGRESKGKERIGKEKTKHIPHAVGEKAADAAPTEENNFSENQNHEEPSGTDALETPRGENQTGDDAAEGIAGGKTAAGNTGTQTQIALVPCPHERILALYHEILPMCRPIREWNKTRRGYLKQRWAEKDKRQNLDWWKGYFEYVKKSKFLTGLVQGQNGKPPFLADLEWLIRPENFVKVIEGKYHHD